jgi:hypothetical protein
MPSSQLSKHYCEDVENYRKMIETKENNLGAEVSAPLNADCPDLKRHQAFTAVSATEFSIGIKVF